MRCLRRRAPIVSAGAAVTVRRSEAWCPYEYALLHSVLAVQASYRGSGGLNTRVTGIRIVPQLPALRFFVRRGNDCSRMSGLMLARSTGLARWAIRAPAAGSQASADYREHGAE